jgi:hypothetical protein
MIRTILLLAALAVLATASAHVRYDGSRTRFALDVGATGVAVSIVPRPARLDCEMGAVLRYDACPLSPDGRAPDRS